MSPARQCSTSKVYMVCGDKLSAQHLPFQRASQVLHRTVAFVLWSVFGGSGGIFFGIRSNQPSIRRGLKFLQMPELIGESTRFASFRLAFCAQGDFQ